MYKPVQAISETDKKEFDRKCANLVSEGYKLSSTSCTAYGYQDAITEVWMAIFVFPMECAS